MWNTEEKRFLGGLGPQQTLRTICLPLCQFHLDPGSPPEVPDPLGWRACLIGTTQDPLKRQSPRTGKARTKANEAVIMLKTIMVFLWELLTQPPEEVINHQEKKKKSLHCVYKKKLPVSSELLMSGEVGRHRFCLTWCKQFTIKWVLFLEEMPRHRVFFLWLITSLGGVLSTLLFIGKY